MGQGGRVICESGRISAPLRTSNRTGAQSGVLVAMYSGGRVTCAGTFTLHGMSVAAVGVQGLGLGEVEALEKYATSAKDMEVVLTANPAVSPAEIEVIMRIVESKERELIQKEKGGRGDKPK